jgi:hypothetical protein
LRKLPKVTGGISLLLGIIPFRFLNDGNSEVESVICSLFPAAWARGEKDALIKENANAPITKSKHTLVTSSGFFLRSNMIPTFNQLNMEFAWQTP